MLSSTYVQVAMQLENDRLRDDLLRLKRWTEDFCDSEKHSRVDMENLLRFAYQLRRQCCFRHMEVHFLPEIQRLLPECSRLISDHEVFHQSSINLLAAACMGLYQAGKAGGRERAGAKALMDQYCQTMLHMLEVEEHVILPLANESISRESWFLLARTLMREQPDESSHHVTIDLQDEQLLKYCPLSIDGRDEKADSGLKYNLSDNSTEAAMELSSLHFGGGQVPHANLTRIHGRPVVQQTHLQSS